MKAAIVDDNLKEAEQMEVCAMEWARTENIALSVECYPDALRFLQQYQRNQVDIVFMDIYMPGVNGIDAAHRLRELDSSVLLVFLTTSVEHMAQAFPCHAFDYLVKPPEQRRIAQVFSETLRVLPSVHRYLELLRDRRPVQVYFSDLIAAVADGNYLEVTTVSETFRCRITCHAFEQKLNGDRRFLSPYRGIFINLEHVSRVEPGVCVMKNGMRLPYRPKDRKNIETELMNYRFARMRSRQIGEG